MRAHSAPPLYRPRMADDPVARARKVRQRWLTAFVICAAATIFFLPLHSRWHIVSTGPPAGAGPVTTACLVASAAGTVLAGVGAVISGLAARAAARTAAGQVTAAQATAAQAANRPGGEPDPGDAQPGGPAGYL